MTLRERVPKPLRGPIGVASLGLMIVGAAIGYILLFLGVTLYFDLNDLGPSISNSEALIVTAFGLIVALTGYFGWRGFLYFSY